MPKHNFLGQHFLKSRTPLDLMVAAAKEEKAVDAVLEIGSGKGNLTRALAKNFPSIVAIEKDRALAEKLQKSLEIEKIKNCEIVAGDILETDFLKLAGGKSYAVVANIPYYLTSRLIRRFLEAKRQPAYMILMVQEEVAERTVARPPDMNLLALSIRVYGQSKIIGRVSKKEFAPEPKVDSAIIKISDISRKFFTENKISEKDFFALVRAGFAQKRKRLSNSLAKFYDSKKRAEEKIKAAGLSKKARAQELSISNWLNLFK